MTKTRVLEIFATTGKFMTQDEVAIRLRGCPRLSSVYSYLTRLQAQGLLVRDRRWGRIVYQLSDRGMQRLRFLEARERQVRLK